MEKFVVERVCEYLDQLRQKLSVPISTQHHSDFDAVRSKMFMAKTIARLETKGQDRTPIETAQLRTLTATQRTDSQQKIYERMLQTFVDAQVERLSAKFQRSATENRILEALIAVQTKGIPEEVLEQPLYSEPTDLYSIKTEHKIQIGSFNCRADVVLLKLPFFETQPNRLVVIVECKSEGKIGNGIEQLQSYLCATDTRFGIFAASLSRDEWKYYENHRHNNFRLISREQFEAQVGRQENAEAKKEKEAKRRIEQAIEYHSQRVEKELVGKYKGKEIEMQADLDREKANLKMRVDEAHKSGFWGGFKVGFWVCVIAVVVIAVIASGG